MKLSYTSIAPRSLLLYKVLLQRKKLSPQEKLRYEQLLRGFIGERTLMNFIKQHEQKNILPLFNCLFEVEETEFQIDSILLTSNCIYLLEVKHFSGDYYTENGKFYFLPTRREIRNPLHQLDRSTLLFKQLFDRLKINLEIKSYVIFTNSNFILYGASPKLPMILLGQIKRFLQKTTSNALPLSSNIQYIAETLINLQKEKSKNERLPQYHITQLKKGVFCDGCLNKLSRKNRHNFSCNICQRSYSVEEVALYTIAQYKLLFPNKKITTKNI